MATTTLILAALTVAVIGVFAVVGIRSPLMMRLGVRNAVRHRKQTLTVVAGLLVGTMVIGASLVTGASLEAGLRATAIGSLGETDAVIAVPGTLLVPQELMERIGAEPWPSQVEGTAPVLLHRAAVELPRTDLYEPATNVIGFEPERDRAFGAFTDATTGAALYGEELGPDEAYLNARLAYRLGAVAGDTVQLTYLPAVVPVVPEIHWLNGTLVAASASPQPDGSYVYQHSAADVFELTIKVPERARGLLAGAFWFSPGNTTDLDVELVAPDNTSFIDDAGTAGPSRYTADDASPVPLPTPPVPVPEPVEDELNTTGARVPAFVQVPLEDTTAGNWTLRVHGKAATDQDYVSFVAVLVPEYDLGRARAAFESLGDFAGDGPLGGVGAAAVEDLNATRSSNLTVAAVVAMEGKATFFYSDAMFVRLDAAQRMFGSEGQVNWLKVTATGGPEAGLDSAFHIDQFFTGRIEALADAADAGPSSPERNLRVTTIKADFLESTEQAAGLFTQFLTLIGSFALVAGVMLIINIFQMLAEERRHELGIARAVGMTRRRLITSFTFEGAVYTVMAAGVGVLAALALSLLLIMGINTLVPDDAFFRVPFAPTWDAVVTAFSIGVLLTTATVLFSSWRASRLDIAQAIRGESDHVRILAGPQARRRVRLIALAALLLGAWTLFGGFWAWSLAPVLLVFLAGPLLALRLRKQPVWIGIGATAVVVTLATFAFVDAPADGSGDASSAIRGLLMVVAATIVMVNLESPPRLMARLAGRLPRMAAVARVAFTYPLARRFRTGLTVSMYGLVLLIITLFSTFFAIFTPDLTTQTGGYDVIGDAEFPVLKLAGVAGVTDLAGMAQDPFAGVARYHVILDHFEFGEGRIFIDGQNDTQFGPGNAQFYGYDAVFAASPGFRLHAWDEQRWGSEGEVWRGVLDDPRFVIVSHAMVADLEEDDGTFADVGDEVVVNTTSGRNTYVIAGIMEQHFFGGVWMGQDELQVRFADFDGLYLFDLDDGVDADAAAARIERAFRGIGMDANSVAEEAREFDQQTTRVFQLLSAYLSLGLIVGVASIGIMTSRAVLERRRELGMLKAIGFTRRAIAATMFLEVLVVLAGATLIGVGLGLAVAYLVFQAQVAVIPGTAFEVPVWGITRMLLVTLAATVVATLLPLLRAARMPAAEALRSIE